MPINNHSTTRRWTGKLRMIKLLEVATCKYTTCRYITCSEKNRSM
uniref:Uncharacterized protein n=1 Tax=Rhizophora mucronata TaxID=61149 RepID=A0A2P2ITT7_RHIMU